MESDTPEVAEQNTSSSKLAPVSLTPVSSLTRVPAGLVPISSIASVGITVLPSARVPPKGVPADVAPTEICEQKVTTIEQNDFFVSESNEVEMAKPSTNSVSALLASLEPAPSTAFLTEDNQHVVDHITRAEAEAEAEATSALPASSATISPIPIKKRIVKPDGSTSSRIPVGSDANRPKTPLRARPSSAGRLQGNPVPNSAGKYCDV